MIGRWLILLFTLLALAAQSVSAYPAAGRKVDLHCCCPKPEACKCHDHNNRSESSDGLGKCGGSDLVALDQLTITELPRISLALGEVARPVSIELAAVVLESRFVEIETPPF